VERARLEGKGGDVPGGASAPAGREGSIRVGVLTTSYPVEDGSASGIFVQRLLRSFPSSIEPTVLAPAPPHRSGWVEGARPRVFAFPYAPPRWRRLAHEPGGIPVALRRNPLLWLMVPPFLAAFLAAARRLARESDLLLANWAPSGAVGGVAARAAGVPLVTVLRGEDVTALARSRWRRAAVAAALARSDRIVCVSEAIRDAVIRAFPRHRDRIVFIPNGVAAADPPHRPRRRGAPLTAITVGSLVPRKRLDTVLHAVASLPREDAVQVLVVGDGPQRSELERLASSLGLVRRVRFTGMVAPEEVPRRLATADVFVLASESEGRPNALLEAMAAGLPVVATRIPGVRELVDHGVTGFLFDVGDAAGLAAALGRLRDDPGLRARLGAAGRRRIAELGLTWERTGLAYARLFTEVLARWRAG